MPIPALVGLGGLSAAITTILTRIGLMLTAKYVARLAILAAIFVLLNVAVDTLFSFLDSTVSPLLSGIDTTAISTIGAFLPSNVGACISAIITVEIACVMYALTVRSLEFQAKLI